MPKKHRQIRFNKRKFAELILYIAERTLGDEDFGMTKMAKALWLCDVRAFARYGKPITGATYQKLEYGPAAKQFIPTLEELIHEGHAARATQEIAGYSSTRVVALRPANIEVFSKEEIALIDSVLSYIREHTAKEVSEVSHETLGWRLADYGETIPYATELIPGEPIPLTPEEKARGYEVAQRIDSCE